MHGQRQLKSCEGMESCVGASEKAKRASGVMASVRKTNRKMQAISNGFFSSFACTPCMHEKRAT